MVDKVKPLKYEDATSGTEVDLLPTEVNPTEDYVAAKGIAFENTDTTTISKNGSDLDFKDETTGPHTLLDLYNDRDSFKYKHMEAMFNSNGATSNKWLNLESSSDPSNNKGYILKADSHLSSLLFITITDDADSDIEVYKNGSLWFTWQIRNRRLAYKSNVPHTITANAGDTISCFARKVTTGTGTSNPNSMTVYVGLCSMEDLNGEGGIQTGADGPTDPTKTTNLVEA